MILLGIYYSAFSSHCSVRNLALGCNNTCGLTAAHQNVLPSLNAEGEGRGSEILSILQRGLPRHNTKTLQVTRKHARYIYPAVLQDKEKILPSDALLVAKGETFG